MIGPALLAVRPQLAVHEVDVGGVDVALEGLHPVALFQHHEGRVDLLGGQGADLERRRRRRYLARTHVGPDHAVDVAARIGARADLVLEGALLGLVGHVHAAAGHVVLPAVVGTAEPALLVAAEEERGAAMRTVGRQQTDVAPGVAEDHEVLAQQADLLGRAVGHGQRRRGQARHPVLAQQIAHRGPAPHPAQQLVVFSGEHRRPPLGRVRGARSRPQGERPGAHLAPRRQDRESAGSIARPGARHRAGDGPVALAWAYHR